MRAIRFRAWNPKVKKMSEPFTFDDFDMGYFIPNGWYLEDMAIMQFTGLFDKHGKEIYEKDIVRCGKSTAVVEWDDAIDQDFFWGNAAGFVFNFSPDKMGEDREIEVIGNIYENTDGSEMSE